MDWDINRRKKNNYSRSEEEEEKFTTISIWANTKQPTFVLVLVYHPFLLWSTTMYSSVGLPTLARVFFLFFIVQKTTFHMVDVLMMCEIDIKMWWTIDWWPNSKNEEPFFHAHSYVIRDFSFCLLVADFWCDRFEEMWNKIRRIIAYFWCFDTHCDRLTRVYICVCELTHVGG